MKFFSKNDGRKRFDVVSEHLGIIIPCLAIILASFFITPYDLEERRGGAKFVPVCLFKKITGIPCPSCGMSRAFCSISRGRLWDAFHYNILSIALYPAVLAGVIVPAFSLAFYFWVILSRRK